MAQAADIIGLQARLQPERLAAHDLSTGERWTFEAFDDLVGRLASYLVQRGCTSGDRVGVIARNSAWLVALHFACGRAGFIFVPLNWRLQTSELLPLIELAEPRLLLGDYGEPAKRLAEFLPVEPLGDFVRAARDASPLAEYEYDLDRPSLILFTSGTGGSPKGVVVTERNLLQTAINFGMLTRVANGSVFLCDAPMFHVIGLVTNVRPVLMQGGTIIISDGFEVGRTLARLADPGLAITHYVGVPQMMEAFRSHPDFDPEALRGLLALVSGGAPHSPADIEAWLADGIPLVLGFGMSEAGTVFGMSTDLSTIRRKRGSAGLAPPTIEVRIVDTSGRPVPSGTPGELLLRGDNLSPAYWRNPEETAKAHDSDGWFATGDIVRCDEDGFFWIVDRRKDMFISGGENVYPAEIEALLIGYPGIRECAMVGVPDARWGEVGHLAIAVFESGDFDVERVRAFLADRLARYKLPKYVSIIEALPRTATGKIQKAVLSARLTVTSRS